MRLKIELASLIATDNFGFIVSPVAVEVGKMFSEWAQFIKRLNGRCWLEASNLKRVSTISVPLTVLVLYLSTECPKLNLDQ